MDDKELLAKLYDENCNHSRHHENLRATMTNLIIFVGTGLLGLVTVDQKLNPTDLALTLFLTLLGIFGALFSSKYYERLRLHRGRARAILDRLDKLLPESGISKLMDDADEANRKSFPWLSRQRLNNFWTLLHGVIALIGIAISGVIVCGWLGTS